MRICYVADLGGLSARIWTRHFAERGHDVHVITTRPWTAEGLGGAKVHEVPLAFMGLLKTGQSKPNPVSMGSVLQRLKGGRLWGHLSDARFRLSALALYRQVPKIRELLRQIDPDLIHALRIPFEGIAAAMAAPPSTPLLISVWGNDFTLWAEGMYLIGRQTRHAMRRTDSLLSDCERDIRLAETWGLARHKPRRVLCGSGGIRFDRFHPDPGPGDEELRASLALPPREQVAINPRGYRSYVPLDEFFQGIQRVVQTHPRAVILCTGLKSNPVAERLVDRYGVRENVRLLGDYSHSQMPALFRLAAICISPSLHDGSPNSVLESMACGCFPVAGDIESVREWITHGRNGLLFDPKDPASVAGAITRALDDDRLRDGARDGNFELIHEKAEYETTMARAEDFYHETVSLSRSGSGV
jgi:glycosyltransferase involved in cell wall biosynthesis